MLRAGTFDGGIDVGRGGALDGVLHGFKISGGKGFELWADPLVQLGQESVSRVGVRWFDGSKVSRCTRVG